VLGILVIYPWPRLRQIPLDLAERTARAAVRRKSLVAAYVIGLFIVLPLVILVIA
jgi:sodium-dependent phosphate cotransporter